MPVWVSLIRAVNLGARNKVNMAQLRDVLAAAGFDDVRTYLQSGNVVTRSRHRNPDRVAAAVRAVLREHFRLDTPVMVRSPAELREVLDWNPFPEDAATRPTSVHVVHLLAEPEPDRVAALLAQDWSPDGVAVRGRDVVVRYAEGAQGTRLQSANGLPRLGVEGTARNWRTLEALVAMTTDP